MKQVKTWFQNRRMKQKKVRRKYVEEDKKNNFFNSKDVCRENNESFSENNL